MTRPECWRLARGLPRCGAASELARLRAELEAARAEVERLRAELEGVRRDRNTEGEK